MANVRELKKGEHSLIGNIIGDSFSNDPVNLWIFKQPMGIENFNTKIAKKLYLQEGFGHVMDDGSGGALWLPSSTKRHIPFYKNIDIALSMIRYGGFKSVPQGMLIDHYLTQKKPIEPHYYLYVIGARTNQQGKGIGGKLMTAGLKRADAEGMPVYLESTKEDNIPFYCRFGFDVIEKAEPGHGCPPLWLMYRKGIKVI